MAGGTALFFTIHDVLRLEKELKGRGVEVRMIPTPRHLSSDCGTALSYGLEDAGKVRDAIRDLGLEVQGIHEA
jgi:hypothetical protein